MGYTHPQSVPCERTGSPWVSGLLTRVNRVKPMYPVTLCNRLVVTFVGLVVALAALIWRNRGFLAGCATKNDKRRIERRKQMKARTGVVQPPVFSAAAGGRWRCAASSLAPFFEIASQSTAHNHVLLVGHVWL